MPRPVGPREERLGLVVADDPLGGGIEMVRLREPAGDVAKMDKRRRAMPLLDVGVGAA